jgi:type II secretory pathway component PulC
VVVAQVGERIASAATVMAVYDEIDPATFKEVGTVVVALPNGQREYCRSGQAPKPASQLTTLPVAALDGVKCSSLSSCTIARSLFDSLTKDMMSLAGMASVSPWMEGGVGKGFRIDYIKPGTALASLQLVPGDQVARINGYEMSDPMKAVQVWQLVRNEKTISIDFKRGGQNQTMSYSIQ